MATTVSVTPQPWVQIWSSSQISQLGLALRRIFMVTAADHCFAAKFAAFDDLGDPDAATIPSTSTPTTPATSSDQDGDGLGRDDVGVL